MYESFPHDTKSAPHGENARPLTCAFVFASNLNVQAQIASSFQNYAQLYLKGRYEKFIAA